MSETVSRAQLDAAIQDLPDATAKAVEAAVMPLIQPAIDKMTASPEDFASELASLQSVGPAVGTAVAASIAKAFAPVTSHTCRAPGVHAHRHGHERGPRDIHPVQLDRTFAAHEEQTSIMARNFMFSAYTTPEGRDSGDYSKDYFWAEGGVDPNAGDYGYASLAIGGKYLYGPLIAQEYPTPTSVKATYTDQVTGTPFVLEVDSSAKTAAISEPDGTVIHDQLYPPYPSYLSLTDDTPQATTGS